MDFTVSHVANTGHQVLCAAPSASHTGVASAMRNVTAVTLQVTQGGHITPRSTQHHARASN